MESHPRLTLGGLLDETLMEGARVISDHADSHAPVTWALPFAEVMTRYDDLDATVVYTRPESLAAKPTSMSSLAARGASAVIVDGPLPPGVTREHMPAGLVVIEMGFPIGFPALNRLLAERTLTQEVHVMRYATHVHQSLAGLLHRGAGMSMLLREVSALSHSPALVLDARCETVAHNGLEKSTLELVVPPLRAGLTGRDDIRDHHDAATVTVSTSDGEWTGTVAPIRLGKYFEGWVVILHRGGRPGEHDLAQHEVVASQATAIIGSEMLRQRSVEEAEERARGDFVQALVHGGFGTEYEMRTRAEYHDIDLDATFAVFATRTSASRTDTTDPQADRTLLRLARYAASLLPHKDVRSYITVLGDIVVVVRTVRGTTPTEIDDEVREYAVAMAEDLTARGHALSAVAYGTAAAGAAQIRESYREARVALDIADRMHITGAVAHQELRSFGVLEQIADTERSRQFTADVLGPIRLGTELHTVLLAYLEHGGNVNAAARALNMHRNTMLSKLDRLSRACGCDIRVPENQFTVWLALRLELLDSLGSSLAREMSYR
ncbi:helix-turn-helix domain-containing protein [Gordonia sp. CPCC 206044]|uniref:PucR family transcriptional regulator n=1 Tax=Gordonia sp. CPCC 206044 TaxID=3140793 RepID=UPI003AF38C8A